MNDKPLQTQNYSILIISFLRKLQYRSNKYLPISSIKQNCLSETLPKADDCKSCL